MEKKNFFQSVAGAQLIQSSVEIDQEMVCPPGHRLDNTEDVPVCGMYLN